MEETMSPSGKQNFTAVHFRGQNVSHSHPWLQGICLMGHIATPKQYQDSTKRKNGK